MSREDRAAFDEPAEPDDLAGPTRAGSRTGWIQRRRERVTAEIERNRRGDYRVPTWVLVVILVALVATWVSVIVFT